jgi:hypothetical protein
VVLLHAPTPGNKSDNTASTTPAWGGSGSVCDSRMWDVFVGRRYLQPGGTFTERYFVRRSVEIEEHTTPFKASRVVLTLRRGPTRDGGRGGDWWCSTAVVPAAENYTKLSTVGAMLVTGGPGRKPLIDCYIPEWSDHFVAQEGDHCGNGGAIALRTLGFVLDDTGAAAAKAAGVATVPLYRCFDNATKNHAVSLSESCDGRGKLEFSVGHIVAALAAPSIKTDDEKQQSKLLSGVQLVGEAATVNVTVASCT